MSGNRSVVCFVLHFKKVSMFKICFKVKLNIGILLNCMMMRLKCGWNLNMDEEIIQYALH